MQPALNPGEVAAVIDWARVKQRLRDSELAANKALATAPEHLAFVCRQRAARLAARRPATAAAATTPILVFGLKPEQYGVALRDVLQVMPFANCTPVPGAPAALLGVLNLRGEIRSVIDLRQILQLPAIEDESGGYLIILRHEDGAVAARVDQVERVRRLAPDELLLPDQEMSHLNGRFAQGVTADKLIVLSTAAIFGHAIFCGKNKQDAEINKQDADIQVAEDRSPWPASASERSPAPREIHQPAATL
jgi:chemotaxis signal transduction protein